VGFCDAIICSRCAPDRGCYNNTVTGHEVNHLVCTQCADCRDDLDDEDIEDSSIPSNCTYCHKLTCGQVTGCFDDDDDKHFKCLWFCEATCSEADCNIQEIEEHKCHLGGVSGCCAGHCHHTPKCHGNGQGWCQECHKSFCQNCLAGHDCE
jgi:hypothetical protein